MYRKKAGEERGNVEHLAEMPFLETERIPARHRSNLPINCQSAYRAEFALHRDGNPLMLFLLPTESDKL